LASQSAVGVTEDDARRWVSARYGEEASMRLATFGQMVAEENARQNLIAPSTIAAIWSRHLLDSAQLVAMAPNEVGTWIDVGTGAGFPGIVAALLLPQTRVTLVEPRRRRVEFLKLSAAELGLSNVIVEQAKVERVIASPADVISARAVASSETLIDLTSHLRTKSTRYILPRGRSGHDEVESLRQRWQGLFHVEQSLTDPDSTIIIASGIA
jgi:16S rRNA (guanine527-N7)-methyltransferase